VGAKVLAGRPVDDPNFRSVTVHQREKGVRLRLNGFNDLSARPFPCHAAEVRNSLVRIFSWLLADTCHTGVGHSLAPQLSYRLYALSSLSVAQSLFLEFGRAMETSNFAVLHTSFYDVLNKA
jgi:hypothetical protein